MNKREFNDIVVDRIKAIVETLGQKQAEYVLDGKDVFHNFNESAKLAGDALGGGYPTNADEAAAFMRKHIVSVFDLINCADMRTFDRINEKIGDAINYLILIEGMLKESLTNVSKSESR